MRDIKEILLSLTEHDKQPPNKFDGWFAKRRKKCSKHKNLIRVKQDEKEGK
jgi:hypothetical protein